VLAALDQVAGEHDSSVAAVALAWLLAQPTVLAPIASATSPAQLSELMAAPALALTADQLERLSRAAAT
jgi:aryl-alcohol dehydrogenase-like predicted oxidoreductase